MEINKLLNPITPACTSDHENREEQMPNTIAQDATSISSPVRSRSSRPKRASSPRNPSSESQNSTKGTKPAKDQPRWKQQPTQGEVKYPVHQAHSKKEVQEFENFRIYPTGDIAEYCDHIPYNANNPKRSFFEKTGLTAFNVFQYQFFYGEKAHTVMWDYNVGLVKTTSFFKALRYAKTQPCKVKKHNKGVEDVMHNITGGAICAQGYWMPYNVAKELAANFCHEIRYALVPVFGHDFPRLCAKEGEPHYRTFHISADTIKACIAEQAEWVRISKTQKAHGLPLTPQQTECKSPPGLSPSTVVRLKPTKREMNSESPTFFQPDYQQSPVIKTDRALTYGAQMIPYSPDISPRTTRSPSQIPGYLPSTPAPSWSNVSTSSATIPGIEQPFLIHHQHPVTWNAINTSPFSPLRTQRTQCEQEVAQALIDMACTPTPSPVRVSPGRKRLFRDYEDDDSAVSDSMDELFDGDIEMEDDGPTPTKMAPLASVRPMKRARHSV